MYLPELRHSEGGAQVSEPITGKQVRDGFWRGQRIGEMPREDLYELIAFMQNEQIRRDKIMAPIMDLGRSQKEWR